MSLANDLRALYHIAASPIKGATHAERLESFYQGQAGVYDHFRKRLLQGREAMYRALEPRHNAVWVDLGGGTGANLEYMADKIPGFKKAYVVDLCPSLLDVARKRIEARGWDNVEAVEADATTFTPPEGKADLVTFSYSLTMIPDWFAAIDHARALLKMGGLIGVVDFYVSRKHPEPGFVKHPWPTRAFWQLWFQADNVFLSPDHAPYLHKRFKPVLFEEHRAPTPYLPLARMPYYAFIGKKPRAAS